ncbi:MAG: hypothetical protein R3A13_12485 [Bdellovibrionota bacterium]
MSAVVEELRGFSIGTDGVLYLGDTALPQLTRTDIDPADLTLKSRSAEAVVVRKLLFDLSQVEQLAEETVKISLRSSDQSHLTSDELAQAEISLESERKDITELPQVLKFEAEIAAGIFPEGAWRNKARARKIDRMYQDLKSEVELPKNWNPETEKVLKIQLPSGLELLGYSRTFEEFIIGAVMVKPEGEQGAILTFISPIGNSKFEPKSLGSRAVVSGDTSNESDRIKLLRIQAQIDRLMQKYKLSEVTLSE